MTGPGSGKSVLASIGRIVGHVDERFEVGSESRRHPWSRAVVAGLVFVLATSTVMIFEGLGEPSLFGDEAIYALVSRTTVETGVWMPLHLEEAVYLNKPPLKIWLVTALFALLGESEFVARLPDAIFGVLTIALVYCVGARRYGIATGLMASALLLAADQYILVHGVRDSVQDTLITLMAMVVCFALVEVHAGADEGRRWWVVIGISVVVVGMCKNMMGVLFALVVVAIEVVGVIGGVARRTQLVAAIRVLAFAAVVAAVYTAVMVAATDGLFFRKLIEDVFIRASRGLGPGHLRGPGYYPISLASDFGWWLLLLAPGIVVAARSWRRPFSPPTWILAAWSLMVVVGFSLSVSKLPWYIYPAYPSLCLVLAVGARALVLSIKRPLWAGCVAGVIAAGLLAELIWLHAGISSDTLVIDSQKFARAYSQLPRATLIVDHRFRRRVGPMRVWDRFYLHGVSNVERVTSGGLTFGTSRDGCRFLACSEPERHPPSEALPWRPILFLRKNDTAAADTWILGTCDLEIPGTIGRDAVFWNDLIAADAFEGGDLGGWSTGDVEGFEHTTIEVR